MLSDDAHPAAADATDDASAEPTTTPTSPTSPAASPVRRPVGPKSRRPPTQLLMREAAASAPSVAAEALLSPTIIFEEPEETAAVTDALDDLLPTAEAQDEDVVAALPARSPIPMRRPLPRGAVPLMLPGGGGTGGFPLPRLSRVPSPHPLHEDSDIAAAATHPVTEETLAPKPRRSPGAASAMPGMGMGDPLALRQQLRKTAMPRSSNDSHPPDKHDAPDHAEVSSPSPPPRPRQPRASHDSPDGPSVVESPAPRLRRATPLAPAVPPGATAPDFLAARQHLRKTAVPGALVASSETELQAPPQFLPQPLPRSTPPARPPPPQIQPGLPPPPLPPKPRERRVGGVLDEDADKAVVH